MERARQALRDRTQPPVLISGNDLGFRVERQQGDVPVGTLVVRINGQWVAAQFATGIVKLGDR